MKALIFTMLALLSVSAFADYKCSNPSSVDTEVCAEITKTSRGFVISDISPDIQKKRSVARELCETFGSPANDYKIKIKKMKSCYYYGTKGFFAGGMVDACLDMGSLLSGRVFSKITCIEK